MSAFGDEFWWFGFGGETTGDSSFAFEDFGPFVFLGLGYLGTELDGEGIRGEGGCDVWMRGGACG